jgi:hypothetical protein
MICIPEGYRNACELIRCPSSVKCLNVIRVLAGVRFTSFSFSMFFFQTWRAVSSLKRDEDPGIAIYTVATGTVAARIYLRAIFAGGTQEPGTAQTSTSLEHGTDLVGLVSAPRPQDDAVLPSLLGCHLLVLQGVLAVLLPHLRAEVVTPASFRRRCRGRVMKTPRDALPERPSTPLSSRCG